MNAIAMREIDAYELAERRRAYIAQQIKDCLIGQIPVVRMSWGWPEPIRTKTREDLLEVLADTLTVYEQSNAIGSLLRALLTNDPAYSDGLNAYISAVIQEWADASHDAMTVEELEALPC